MRIALRRACIAAMCLVAIAMSMSTVAAPRSSAATTALAFPDLNNYVAVSPLLHGNSIGSPYPLIIATTKPCTRSYSVGGVGTFAVCRPYTFFSKLEDFNSEHPRWCIGDNGWQLTSGRKFNFFGATCVAGKGVIVGCIDRRKHGFVISQQHSWTF